MNDIVLPCNDQQGFGQIVKHLGAAMFLVRKSDGKTITSKQRGGMSYGKKGKRGIRESKKLKADDWILYSERDLGGNVHGDILEKYTEAEVRWLQLNDYIRIWEEKDSGLSSNVVFVATAPEKKENLSRDLPSDDEDEEEEDEDEDKVEMKEEEEEEEEEEKEDFFKLPTPKAKKSKCHKEKELVGFAFVDELYKKPCDKVDRQEEAGRAVSFTPSFQRHVPDSIKVRGVITWWDRSRGCGEASVVLEMKERRVSISRNAIQASVRQGLLMRDKVLFSRDRINMSIFESERGYEALTISV